VISAPAKPPSNTWRRRRSSKIASISNGSRDQLGAQLVDQRDRLDTAVNALAQAGDSLIGLNSDPQVHAVAAARRRLNSRDLHNIGLMFKQEQRTAIKEQSVATE